MTKVRLLFLDILTIEQTTFKHWYQTMDFEIAKAEREMEDLRVENQKLKEKIRIWNGQR